MNTDELNWKTIGLMLRVPDIPGPDYLGQIAQVYRTDGEVEWLTVLTVYPKSEGFKKGPGFHDLINTRFATIEEAKAAVAEALAYHQIEEAGNSPP